MLAKRRFLGTCVSHCGELKAYSKQRVLGRRRNVCDEEQVQMPEGSSILRGSDAETVGSKGCAHCRPG